MDEDKIPLEGMAVETVFMCDNCDGNVVIVKHAESVNCPLCEKPMENAGWFEASV